MLYLLSEVKIHGLVLETFNLRMGSEFLEKLMIMIFSVIQNVTSKFSKKISFCSLKLTICMLCC